MPSVSLILVPVDFSPGADAAARYAFWLAARLGARLRVVHALADGESEAPHDDDTRQKAEASLANLVTRLAQTAPGTVPETEVLASGLPVPDAIVAAARRAGADLVVMATHGGSRTRRMLLGSVTDEVVRMADCPVLTVK